MNIKKTSAFLISLALFLVLGVTIAYAMPTGSGANIEIKNPFSGGSSLTEILKKIINDILLPIGGVVAVMAFIYAGFLYVMAQGNEAGIKKAHNALLYTSIGTAILLGSWVIAQLIEGTINQLK